MCVGKERGGKGAGGWGGGGGSKVEDERSDMLGGHCCMYTLSLSLPIFIVVVARQRLSRVISS